jgi:prevent-host-death family protein
VGVRELRQNLSKYLRRVINGERLEVTERGRPVAVLAPLSETTSALGRLVGSGRARPEGCIYSDHAADLGFPPPAHDSQAPLTHDLTGSTSGQRRGSLSNT